jgi:hypothetical protein
VAVRLFTKNASALLGAIKAAIDKGDIDTWAYDSAGDFTHTPRDHQWDNRAWLRPVIQSDRLRLNIIFASGEQQPREVYGIYHGRFIEMAVVHFPKLFETGAATANMTKEDKDLKS